MVERRKTPSTSAESVAKARSMSSNSDEGQRVAKVIARAGLCSRRDAERWIADGRVRVNGHVLATPAVTVQPSDLITVDGKSLPEPGTPRLWRYHKPRSRVTTHHDPQGRRTAFESLSPEMPRVISVGRLDYNTEGLLLLTTNGALARHLELPTTGWLRKYRARAHGQVSQADLDKLQKGVEVEGVRYEPIEARLDRKQGSNLWLTLGLREGKNREVRRVLRHLGLEVNRLIRTSFGPFQLGDLATGAVDEVKTRIIADQLGAKLAGELGLRGLTALVRTNPKRLRDPKDKTDRTISTGKRRAKRKAQRSGKITK